MSDNDSSISQSEGEYPINSDEPSSEGGWVQWFCSLEGHDFLAEVSEEFLHDSSNLYGLKSKIPNYSAALALILSGSTPNEQDLQDEQFLDLYQSCTDLYGLVHARFIQTPPGLAIMREKYLAGRFGTCSRVLCERHNVVPVGMASEIRTSRVKVFCPRCQDVYYPKERNGEMDGAYFGTSFPHVLLQSYPDLYPLQEHHKYAAKISGFKVHNGRGVYAEKIETKYRTEIKS